jgi:hypothetical protein
MVNDGIILLQDAAPNPQLFPKLQRMKVGMLGMLEVFYLYIGSLLAGIHSVDVCCCCVALARCIIV